jgi:hypothetical protein
MKNFISLIILLLFFLSSCGGNSENISSKNSHATQNARSEKDLTDSELSKEEEEEKELTVDERVEQIRGWYAEIQKIGMNNCIAKRKTRYEKGLLPESDEIPFEQLVKTCELSEDFELIRGEFSGYEWDQEVSVYKRKGKTFFIFVTGGAESWVYENRYYFDSNENLIRHLVKESWDGQELNSSNKEKKIDPKKKNVKVCAKEYFDEIEFFLGKRN